MLVIDTSKISARLIAAGATPILAAATASSITDTIAMTYSTLATKEDIQTASHETKIEIARLQTTIKVAGAILAAFLTIMGTIAVFYIRTK
jgi:hypothetical protein